MSNVAKNGFHAANMPFNRVPSEPNGPPTPRSYGYRIGAGQFRYGKLLQSDHTPQDAAWLKERGLQVLVRVKGEAVVYHRDVLQAISDYAGLATVLEVGNEPAPADLWTHIWYMDRVADECLDAAHQAGMLLCTGGWQADTPAPTGSVGIGARVRQVYNRFDALGVHCYSPWDLLDAPTQAHLAAWHAAFSNKPIYITESGIAAKALGDTEKAHRYATFVQKLPDYVVANFFFITGGTASFASFGADPNTYDPNGGNSFWLTDAAWAELGRAL